MKWLAAALLLAACNMVDVYEGNIQSATKALAAAKTDAERAAALSDRGRNYSDKGRLSFARHQIGVDEYRRLFDLSMADHARAIELAPKDADAWFKRGLSNYDRAAWAGEPGDRTPWWNASRADMAKAVELDPKLALGWDYLGLIDEQTNRFEQAIVEYTKEMEFDKRARTRLADLYCNRGNKYLGEKKHALAKADLQKSVELGATADGCSCEPYNSLAYILIDVDKDYDAAWKLVKTGAAARRALAPEYMQRLIAKSGRKE